MPSLELLRKAMADQGVEALLVSDPTNIRWLTGFSGSYGRAVVTADGAQFITDGRYTLQAAEQVTNMPAVSFSSPTDGDEFLLSQLKTLGVDKLWFDPQACSYAGWQQWGKKLAAVELIASPDLFSPLRMSKSPDEVATMGRACGIADACFQHVRRLIQQGVTELDIALDLEFFMRRQSAGVAFPSIVVSGERSARPHGTPSEKALEVGDFVTMDFGARVDGYNSDITRTVVVGEASDRHREVYGAVLESQLAAIDALRPGVPAKEVDRAARAVLDKYGLAQYFTHGLGHGLGILVHDAGRLSGSSDDVIAPNQVWTIEPGVYIPGFGGVRIEDDVLVTETGIEILTHSPKELLVLPASE